MGSEMCIRDSNSAVRFNRYTCQGVSLGQMPNNGKSNECTSIVPDTMESMTGREALAHAT